MGVEHGLNPYLHGPSAISHDPVFRYVGHGWRHVRDGLRAALHAALLPARAARRGGGAVGDEAEALLASAGTLALVWRCARARGLRPGRGAARRRRQPAVRDLRARRRPQRPADDAAMMAAVALMLAPRPTARRGSGRRGGRRRGRADQGDRRGAAAVHDPRAAAARARAWARSRRSRRARSIAYAAFGVPRRQHRRRAEPRRGVRLDRQLPQRDRAPVRQAGRVPGRPRPAQGRARADRGCTCCGAPGAATTGSPPRAGRCSRSRSRAPGCSPGTSSGRCRSPSSAATGGCWSRRSRVQGLFVLHQISPLLAPVK